MSMAAAVQLAINSGVSKPDAVLTVSVDFEEQGEQAGVRTVERAFDRFQEDLRLRSDDELKSLSEFTLDNN